MTASSYLKSRPPWHGRLDHESSNWTPNLQSNSEHWIQIDFVETIPIIGILIQGGGASRSAHVKSFHIASGNETTSLELIREAGRALVSK